MVHDLESGIEELNIDMSRIRFLVIGHAHFDHCGAVPYLQKKYPHIQVLASRGAGAIFGMEKAVRNIRAFSLQVMEGLGIPMERGGISMEFDGVRLAKELKEGDRIELGDLRLDVYESPGHSRCGMILYEPNRKWLFPSDSMCFPTGDDGAFLITASESYRDYLESLKKVENLDVRMCAWEHHGLMTDEDAEGIVRRVMDYAVDFKEDARARLERGEDPESLADELTRDWLDRSKLEFLSYDIMMYITRRMLQNALEEDVSEFKR